MAKQFEHPLGEKDRRLILLALKKLRTAGVKEIHDWMENTRIVKKVPTERTIHTQLNELMEDGKVERRDHKYKLTTTVTMADIFYLSRIPEFLSSMKMINALIQPELKNGNVKDGAKIEKLLGETIHLISQANNIAKSVDV